MSRMLSRFSFSFLALAAFLFYEGYRLLTQTVQPPVWRVALYFIAGGMSVGLGIRGIRARHRDRYGDRED